MSLTQHDLALRLDALERQNRRLKRGGIVAALGLAALGMQSFAAPTVCDVVSAERIVLRNSRGRARIVMDAYSSGEPTITFHDQKGKAASRLQLNSAGGLDVSVFKVGKPVPATFRSDGSSLTPAEMGHEGSGLPQPPTKRAGSGVD